MAVGAAALAIWLISSGDENPRPKDDPVVFLRGIVRDVAANDYEHVWLTLHPAQQAVATESLYVRCERLTPVPGRLRSITLVRSEDRPVAVAGSGTGPVASKAVTFDVKLVGGASSQAVVVRQTAHAVAVAGHWRWILSPRRFASYRAGSCP